MSEIKKIKTLTIGGRTYEFVTDGIGEYTLPKATNNVRGGVKLTTATTLTKAPQSLTTTDGRTYQVQMNGNEQLVVNVPWTNTTYILPVATATILGGVKPTTKTTAMTQDVGVDASGKLYTIPADDSDVNSINGKTGVVVLNQDDIADGTTYKRFSKTEKDKLDGIAAGAQVNTVTSVAGKTGVVTLTKSDVGLENVDNTSDANKPVSTAQATAIAVKADKTYVDEQVSTKIDKTEVNSSLALKIDKTSIADNLTTNDATKVLSAKQGKVLKDNYDALSPYVPSVLIWTGTQAQYDDIVTKDSDTLYFIIE